MGGAVAGQGYNVAVGYNAMLVSTSASGTTAIGNQCLDALTTGNNNTGVGAGALGLNTTGATNVAVGWSALDANTTGHYLTAVGAGALGANTTANSNTGVGENALSNLTTGAGNTATGGACMDQGVVTGNNNTAVGHLAARYVSSGAGNTAVGGGAGDSVTTGSNNSFLGLDTGYNLTTGSANVYVGYNNTASAVGVDNELLIGSNANGGGTNTARFQTSGGSATLGLDGSDTSWAAASDSRLKKDVATSAVGLDFIKDLRPITFKWNAKNAIANNLPQYDASSSDPVHGSGKTQHGFLAQEVKTAIDEHSGLKDGFTMWREDPDGTQQVAPTALVPMLVKAVQELSAKVEELETKLNNKE
jgi:hypothetical protein